VAETKPGGTLARTHEGQPGLPRGRNGLPLRAVRASQRERLLRSVIAAVSDIGYPAVTVADVVRRARSRLGERCYDLLENNCEHFCEWCLRGTARSFQVEAWLTRPRVMLLSILRLIIRVPMPSLLR